MSRVYMGVLAGAVSGLAAWFLSTYSLAYTSAWAMPAGFPLQLWSALVVFGTGVTSVALLIHFSTLWAVSGRPAPALIGFAFAFVAALAATSQLQLGQAVTAAAFVGAAIASVAHLCLRPNNSSKPTPLRGAA